VRILGLDTATAATAVALLDTDTGVGLTRRDDPPRGDRPRHATRLLGLIADALEGDWDSLHRIAVGLGPGTFTGLRIGVATARALSHARGIPLVGISTLRALALNAQQAPAGKPLTVLAAIDARRGEVFAAAWRLGEDGDRSLAETLLEPSVLRPETLADRTAQLGRSLLAIGSGAVEFRSYLERAGVAVPGDDSVLHSVNALNHCRLAAAGEGTAEQGEIKPCYLRLPDAELARKRRATQ